MPRWLLVVQILIVCLLISSPVAASQVEVTGLTPTINLVGGDFPRTGYAVSGVGDLDGDGIPDMVVGRSTHPPDTNGPHGVHVVPGSMLQNVSSVALGTTPTWISDTSIFDFRLGSSVTNLGDVDGDGYADLLVGTDFTPPNGVDHAGIIPGGPSIFEQSLNDSASKIELWDNPATVQGVGDVNGDGRQDFLTGVTPVTLVLGQNSTPTGVINENHTVTFFPGARHRGYAGDLDGDGLNDIALSDFEDGEIEVLVYLGRSNWSPTLEPQDANITLPIGVALLPSYATLPHFTAGDLDGDGFDDLVIGNNSGKVWVLWGGGNLTANSSTEVLLDQPASGGGMSLDASADIDGDGANDLLIVRRWSNDTRGLQIFAGQPGTRAVIDTGLRYNTSTGISAVSYIGDINLDGRVDFALGTPGDPNGSAMVFTNARWDLEEETSGDDRDEQGEDPDWRRVCLPSLAILVISIAAVMFEFRWLPGRPTPGTSLTLNQDNARGARPPDLQR